MVVKVATPIVTFINPPGPSRLYRGMVCTYVSKANYIWQPQDFVTLSAHIPDGYSPRFIDCSINHISEARLFDEIRSIKPVLSIIAISSIVFDADLKFLKNFRKNFPDSKCLILGDVLLERAFWEGVLEYADGLLLNSMDVDLENYIRTYRTNSANLILRDSNPPVHDKMKNKSVPKKVSIGIPRHKIFINKRYRFPFVKSYLYTTVASQFGCPFYCSYCSGSSVSLTYRDCNEVLMEIEEIERLGIRDIFFGDSSFGFPEENALGILKGIIRRDLSIRWCCYAHPESLNGHILELMKKAKCHTIIIGIDDANFDLLRSKYQREMSEVNLKEFCDRSHKLGMQICGDFVIGLDENPAAIEKIMRMSRELKLDFASFNILTNLFGSTLREELVNEGKLDPQTVGYDTSGTFGWRDEGLYRLRNLAIKRFYLRPSYLLRRITKIRSLVEFEIQLGEMIGLFKNIKQRPKNLVVSSICKDEFYNKRSQ